MIKKSITYEDYNGDTRTEDFYFNLTEAEITKMSLSTEGGLETLLRKIINEKDVPKLSELFEQLITMSYGEKSLDGKRFIKKDDNGRPLWQKFVETEAFSSLYMDLITDTKMALEFVKGILPAKISKEINDAEIMEQVQNNTTA